MPTTTRIDHLLELGLAEATGLSQRELLAHARGLPDAPGVVAVHPGLADARRLTPLLHRSGKPGFVVEDLTDLEEFSDQVDIPEAPLYLLKDVHRGDEMRNWSPDEALPAITARGRTPLTLTEGISWLLQDPGRLEPNHCFMTLGTRRRKATATTSGALDARTPAIWISGGTGRDGAERAGAPKVGWCWAGNRHTWLGFASTAGRLAPDSATTSD